MSDTTIAAAKRVSPHIIDAEVGGTKASIIEKQAIRAIRKEIKSFIIKDLFHICLFVTCCKLLLVSEGVFLTG